MAPDRPPVPAALARRLAAAVKRTQASPPPKAAPIRPNVGNQAKARAPARVAALTSSIEKSAIDGAAEGMGTEQLADAPATIAQRLRGLATRPDVLAMLTDDELVAVWRAMVRGAATSGAQGTTDRQSLFRAAGMPFTAHIGSPRAGASGGPGARGPAIGDRLERALARASGHAGVTGADDEGANPSETGAEPGDSHKIEDHVSVPGTSRPTDFDGIDGTLPN